MEFQEFPKMARLSRPCIVTEKIDGTNAQIWIAPDGDQLLIGSRTRWITPKDDNFGFASWVMANEDEIRKLGPGRHFGEWWGKGIQRGYDVPDKRLSLFNVSRWCLRGHEPQARPSANPKADPKMQNVLPECVGLVPILWEGTFSVQAVEASLASMEAHGSLAAPGFMDPEGVVVFHVAAGIGFKKTIKGDEVPKSAHARK